MEFLASLSYNYADWGPLALRLAVGAIFLVHGLKKWGMWKKQAGGQMPGGMLALMRLLSLAEPLGGLALLVGFLTQLAALGLGLIMLGALWFKITVWKTPFTAPDKNGWEFDLLILAATITLVLIGPGALSADWFLGIV